MKGNIFVLIVYTSLLAISLSKGNGNDYEIKYLLRLQWLPGQCIALGHNCIHSKVVDDNWTIHGLWTDGDCDKGDHEFNEHKLTAEIIEDLKKYWIDIKNETHDDSSGPIYKFWEDEFKKHGCVTNFEELEYFRKALEVYKRYNPYMKFQRAGITPGKSYSKDKFEDIFDNYVLLKCNDNNSINELQICFNEDYETVDCYRSRRSEVCSSEEDIIYLRKDDGETLHRKLVMKQRIFW